MVNNTLADLQSINTKVTTRSTSWADMAMRAWGGEYHAPDHRIYNFSNGRSFDSTDKGLTGLYGVDASPNFEFDELRYPDMDTTLQRSDADDLIYLDGSSPAVANTFQAMLTESFQQLVQENGFRILI